MAPVAPAAAISPATPACWLRRHILSKLASRTNPEELIAAAHAGCFTMALAFGLQGAGFDPTELATEAAVTLEPEGDGFKISRSALTLRAKVPNLDQAAFARIAGEAEKKCPVSKVLKAMITLDAKLIQ
jgi:osmotically inducible protein OsmC